MENGKPFVPPILTKRDLNYPRLNIHCNVCGCQVDGYTITEKPASPDGKVGLAFNIYCHGSGLLWGVEPDAVADFWAEMHIYRQGIGGPPFRVFEPKEQVAYPATVPAGKPKPEPLDLIEHTT